MLNACRLSRFLFVAILRHYWLLIALGVAVNMALTADAAELGLLDYFHACGIGDDAFAKFSDDRQAANEELDVIRRVAVRLRDCPADRLQHMMPRETSADGSGGATAARFPLPETANGQRGRTFQLQGTIMSVERVDDPVGEPLWRYTLSLSEYPHRAVVYVAEEPEKLRAGSTGLRVAVDGVFMKYVPGPAAEPIAVVVAPRLQWRPESPLGNLGMDFGLLEGIQDQSPLMAADHEAFYRLLLLSREADPARLSRDADRLDASPRGLPALFRDPGRRRGRLVKLSGIARRIVRVPIDDPSIVSRLGADHYYEIDLVADGAQGNPLIFCTLDLPGGIPLGGQPSFGENIEVTGFFLKNWQYPTALSQGEKDASPGSSQALQTSPLVIGPAPRWKPAVAERKSSTGAAAGGLLVLAMIGVCLLLWHFRQSDQEFSRQVIARE